MVLAKRTVRPRPLRVARLARLPARGASIRRDVLVALAGPAVSPDRLAAWVGRVASDPLYCLGSFVAGGSDTRVMGAMREIAGDFVTMPA